MKPSGYDQVHLQGMVFYGHVGVHESEKVRGQDFIIDASLFCPPLAACESDALDQTIDYGQAYALIQDIVQNARFDLIERLADEIAARLLDRFQLAEMVEITVSKPHAPISGHFQAMSVRITRKRS
jgi:7,8-dihydroneopterin aldolase/epimerase/oxygenase